ncbi:hypothetical protein C2E31_04100 [Rhodopirellula baltica]|nr:hypothetical protein C2E31_04100 [Rhodopirellula baltica]
MTRVIDEANRLKDGTPSAGLRDALNALAERQAESQLESDHEVERQLADRLDELNSAPGAGFLAVYLGARVESGADPNISGPSILQAMLRFADAFELPPDDDDDAPIDSSAVIGLELLGQGLVAHVSRSEPLLQQMSNDTATIESLERVEHISAGPTWVLELLRKRSGELLVIHVADRRGFDVEYNNLSNCFHLFTLLQAALQGMRLGNGGTVDSDLVAVASGDAFHDAADSAWWHYGVGGYPEADFGGSVWGEATPDTIPTIDGRQVILLWPPLFQARSWDAGFFSPFLQASPPKVSVINELDPTDVQNWCERLNLPTIKSKRRWRFW